MKIEVTNASVTNGPVTEVPHFALGMAALLERQGFTVAAAELRRLQIDNDALGVHLSERMKDLFKVEAQRDALLEALKQIEPILARMYGPQAAELPPMQIVRAAIAKAKENT